MRSIAVAASLTFLGLFLVSTSARAEDTAAPVIEHTPVTKADKGAIVSVVAKVTDESKFFPQVFFRYTPGGSFEKPLDLRPIKNKKNMFGAAIPNKGPYVEYYLEAYDEFGNGPGRAGSPEAPFKVNLSGEEAPVAVVKKEPAREETTVRGEEPAKRSAPPLATTASRSNSGGSSRTLTWIVGGTGVGLLVGGLLAGVAVKSADSAYQSRLSDPQNSPASLQEQYDANKSLGTKATILTTAGVVLLAGGVALYFLEPGFGGGSSSNSSAALDDKKVDGVQVAAVPLDRGGAVAVAGRF